MQTRAKGKFWIHLLAFAVAMLAIPAIALAQETTDSTGTDTSSDPAISPTIRSDKDDYAPGELVTLTGSNWQPGESIRIFVDDADNHTWQHDVTVTAYDDGTVFDEFNLPDSWVSNYSVEATGQLSGTATTTFTDSLTANGATVNGANASRADVVFPVVVGPGDLVPGGLTTAVGTAAEPNAWQATRWTIGSSSACQNKGGGDDHFSSGTFTEFFDMTAPSAPGTYNPTFQPFDSGTCASGAGDTTFTLTGGVTVDSSVLFSEYFGSASNPDTPFWNDENQLSASDCEDTGPVNGNWFESLAKGCTISTTNLNSRPINTFGRQNIHVKFTWGRNNLPSGTTNNHLDLYWKPSSSSTWSGPVCQSSNPSCSHTVQGIGPGTGTESPTANSVDVTLPAAANNISGANNDSIDIRFQGNTQSNTSTSTGNLRLDAVRVTGDPLPASKLAFTTSAFSGVVGDCLGPITVQTQNANNAATNVSSNTTVNLTTDNGTNGAGAFYGDSGCATSTTSRTINAGNSSTTPFYYKATDRGGGSHVLTASAGGLTSATQTQTIGKANQATLTLNAPASMAYGQNAATLTTSGGSGTGAVSYSVGSSNGCSVSGDQLSVTNASGSCSVTATKAADNNYNSTTSDSKTVTLQKANQAALSITGAPSSATYGQSITTLSTSGGTTGGAITWSAGTSTACAFTTGSTLNITSGTGTCSITATMAGDDNYNSATSQAHQVAVSKANQEALAVISPDSGTYGDKLPIVTSGGSGSGALSFDTGASTACQIGTGADAGKLLITGGTGTCSVTATKAADDNYKTTTSQAHPVIVNKAALTVEPNPKTASRQYSDSNPSFSPSYAGFVNGETVAVLDTKPTCSSVATTSSAPGPYTIACSGGTDNNYAFTYVPGTLTVTQEDATLGYTGPYFAATASATATSANVTLNALVTQANDSNAGDLTKAKVEFLIYKSTNLTMASPDYKCAAPSVSASGVATCQLPLGLDSFTVVVSFANGSYFNSPNADASVLTVYQPATDKFLTGGGWIVDPSTGNLPVAISAANNHGNFGFTVRYKKGSTTEPQGQSVYVFRGANGYDYIVKSNSWQSGALAFPTSTTAGFSGKANVTVINPATGLAVTGLGGGNYSFRVDATDNGSPGTADKYALSVYTPTGTLYHQAGTTAGQILLGGGNIVVHTK